MTVSLSGLAATLPVEFTNTMELGGGDDPAPAACCANAAPCAAMPTATLAATTHTVMARPLVCTPMAKHVAETVTTKDEARERKAARCT